MKTLPTQERALLKRQALLDAAVEEFSNTGFEVATAKSIAALAKVATGTFYQYFENKNDILRVLAANRFANLHAHIKTLELKVVENEPDSTKESIQRIEDKFFNTLLFVYQFHAHDPELHQVLEQRRSIDSKLKIIMDDGEKVLQDRVLGFVKSFNLTNSEQVADNLFAMAEGLVHKLVFHTDFDNKVDVEAEQKNQLSLKVAAQMLASFFLDKTQSAQQS